MYKEVVISIMIIIVIVLFDSRLQQYTDKCVEDMSQNLYEIKEDISKQDVDSRTVEEKTENLYQRWTDYHEKLAYYIEHDELEKVETDFTAGKSFIQSKQYGDAKSELEKTIFVLEHIKDKYMFNLENIF